MPSDSTIGRLRWLGTRRRFLNLTLTGGAFAAVAPSLLSARSPSKKLNLGFIGVGGQGAVNLEAGSSENVAALCDVNETVLASAARKYPHARRYVDYRKMFEDSARLDGVVISTPDHTHALAVMLALKRKLHVYCETPLAHSVWEARMIAQAYERARVATQMGNQFHSCENYRRVVELIWHGVIGPVREAHVWVSHTFGWRPAAGGGTDGDTGIQKRPAEGEPPPKELHWDLWLGPAPERPFHSAYYPSPNWQRWWDFGGGTLAALGGQWLDLVYWALKLNQPRTISAYGPPPNEDLAPASMSANYFFGVRSDMPSLKVSWHQGLNKPPILQKGKIPSWENGVLFVGDEGMLLADADKYILLPEENFRGFKPPQPSIPAPKSHFAEWIEACKEGKPTGCNFDYASTLTEIIQLANVAYRVGKMLQWDPVNLRATNCPNAESLIINNFRKGWELPL